MTETSHNLVKVMAAEVDTFSLYFYCKVAFCQLLY